MKSFFKDLLKPDSFTFLERLIAYQQHLGLIFFLSDKRNFSLQKAFVLIILNIGR